MSKKYTLPFTPENLRQFLEINPQPLNLDQIASIFDMRADQYPEIKDALDTLKTKRQVRIERPKRKNYKVRYRSTSPISDVVIARLKEKPATTRVELEILGLKQEQIVPVFLSQNLIKRLENSTGQKLIKGSHVAVV